MAWIEVHRDTCDKKRFFLNLDNVEAIEDTDNACITFTGNHYIGTQESYKEIKALIEEAEKNGRN